MSQECCPLRPELAFDVGAAKIHRPMKFRLIEKSFLADPQSVKVGFMVFGKELCPLRPELALDVGATKVHRPCKYRISTKNAARQI